MELYHIHKLNEHDESYEEGIILYPGSEFNKMHERSLENTTSYIASIREKNGISYRYRTPFTDYLEKKLKRKNTSDEEYNSMINFIQVYMYNSAIDFREMILEEVRREFYPTLPSRYSCIWLTDEECLEYWKKQLNVKDKYEIFKVEAIGNIFVSRDFLLPGIHLPHGSMYKLAHGYWNPSEENLRNVKDKEYLFEGELKLIKRIK